jgi:CheY-like chemotaxis protein
MWGMKGKILIVEDDAIIGHLIAIILERKGFVVVGRASSGEEALALAVEKAPDLALMDIRLQGRIDGIDAAVHFRTLLNIPVIFISANTDEKTFERAKLAQAYGYISKPFNERDIYSAIQIALYSHATRQDAFPLFGHFKEWDTRIVAMADSDGKLFHLDQNGEQLLGISREKAFSHTLDEMGRFRNPLTMEPIPGVMEEAVQGQHVQRDLALVRENGDLEYMALEATPLRTLRGERQGILCILHPI